MSGRPFTTSPIAATLVREAIEMAGSGGESRRQVAEVIRYGRTEPAAAPPDIRLPERPEAEVRSSGLFGLGVNRQALAHQRRITEIYHLGVETSFAEQMAIGGELTVIDATADGLGVAEAIVCGHPQDGVAAMVAADLAGDMAARTRVRHARLAEAFDAEVMNIIHRR